tara:strand:+ start:24 stop:1541 length:1518 start_codon:yes stop_codon:yes gene_type:complete
VISDKINIYKNQILVFFIIFSVYLSRVLNKLFPANYQQDDISELRVVFYNDILCAIRYSGDNHPLLAVITWIASKIFVSPEYVISFFIVLTTIVSFFLMFKILDQSYPIYISILGLVIILFSPVILTYSISLKQYIFELFACLYSFRFVQLYLNNKIKKGQYSRYILFSSVLVLISFVNILPFIITIIFILFHDKKLRFKQIAFPLFLLLPFSTMFIDKLQRVSSGGYWDSFFLSTNISSMNQLIKNFYFLITLFIKSLFIENLLFVALFLFFVSLIIPFITKDKLTFYAFIGIIILFLISALRLYPLGAGRTDIVFLPYFVYLIAAFFNWLSVKTKLNYNFLFVLISVLYILNGYLNSNVYYKDENVTPLIEIVKEEYNNQETLIVVEKDQYSSILYYSKNLVNNITIEDPNKCLKTLPNITNLYVSHDKNLIQNYSSIPLINSKSSLFSDSDNKQVYLIGIELDGTVGNFRETIKVLEENLFYKKTFKIFDSGLTIGYFEKNG